jgi:hypothetical protein
VQTTHTSEQQHKQQRGNRTVTTFRGQRQPRQHQVIEEKTNRTRTRHEQAKVRALSGRCCQSLNNGDGQGKRHSPPTTTRPPPTRGQSMQRDSNKRRGATMRLCGTVGAGTRHYHPASPIRTSSHGAGAVPTAEKVSTEETITSKTLSERIGSGPPERHHVRCWTCKLATRREESDGKRHKTAMAPSADATALQSRLGFLITS